MNGRLQVAVVGCGVQAQLALIPALIANPSIELVALCDTDVRKLHLLSARYNIKRYYTDFDRLKEDPEVNAVVIATPNYLHAPMAMAAMENGKDVLCEMPLAVNASEAEEILRTAQRTRRRLMPCLVTRLRADVKVVRRYVEDKGLGQLYYAKTGWLRGRNAWSPSTWQKELRYAGGGAFLVLGTALLDSALWLVMPAKPVSVIGVAAKRVGEGMVEDTAFALIRFDSGLVLTIEVGWSLLMERDFVYFNLFGTHGAALLNPLTINKEVQGRLVNITPQLPSKGLHREAYKRLIELWVDSLLRDVPPDVSVGDAILINRIVDAFYRSNASGSEVKLG
ncbi:MAG: Gfo/Idh/MocA family oxidoreductase [candidate division WOR-3 bacterium]